jgi:hypothetical protein
MVQKQYDFPGLIRDIRHFVQEERGIQGSPDDSKVDVPLQYCSKDAIQRLQRNDHPRAVQEGRVIGSCPHK